MRVILFIGLLLAGACNDDAPQALPGLKDPPCHLTYSFYKITKVDLGASLSEARATGLDFGDDSDAIKNRLGFARAGFSCESILAPAILSAVFEDTHWIMAVGTCRESSHTRTTLVEATAGGDGTYRIVEPLPVPAVGDGEEVADGTGSVPLSIFFEQTDADQFPIWVPTLGLGVRFLEPSSDAIQGVLGFGVSPRDATQAGSRLIASMLTSLIAYDIVNPGLCSNADLYRSFDGDGDGVVLEADLQGDDFVVPFFSVDIDLVDELGDVPIYNPWSDFRSDHMSMGMRFEAIAVEAFR